MPDIRLPARSRLKKIQLRSNIIIFNSYKCSCIVFESWEVPEPACSMR
jgi:hypothetical protein